MKYRIEMYMVIEGPRDGLGRAAFTLFWSDPEGVFRTEPSKEDGKPVGFRRGQCFCAVPEEYLGRGARLVESEAAAKKLAWTVSPLVAETDPIKDSR